MRPREISISVDGDWADYHDLGECYSAMNWILTRNFLYPSLQSIVDGIVDSSSPSCTRLDMRRLSGEQGEHEQAIAEFEKALPGLTDRTTVHPNLLSLYREIGHAAMATKHEKLAEELNKE